MPKPTLAPLMPALALGVLGGCAGLPMMPAVSLYPVRAAYPGPAAYPAAPYAAPAYPAPAAATPVAQITPVTGVAGLQSREPDACHAATYRSAVGQPGSVVPTLGVRGEYRIAEFRGIEPQEYHAQRVVFRLDQSGIITAVDCG